jgi:hypothetical protein
VVAVWDIVRRLVLGMYWTGGSNSNIERDYVAQVLTPLAHPEHFFFLQVKSLQCKRLNIFSILNNMSQALENWHGGRHAYIE